MSWLTDEADAIRRRQTIPERLRDAGDWANAHDPDQPEPTIDPAVERAAAQRARDRCPTGP